MSLKKALILLSAVAILATPAANAADLLDLLTPVGPYNLGPNAAPVPMDDCDGNVVTFPPGGSFTCTADAEFPSDSAVWTLNVTSMSAINITVEDCCLLGDTICLKPITPSKPPICATSPDLVIVGGTIPAGTYSLGTAYSDSPGGFPASYFVDIF